jgi:aminopeptidase N
MSAPFRFLLPLLLAAGLNVFAESPFSFDATPGQLPKTVVPRHYAIKIQPDLQKFTTRGSVTVDLEVRKPVDEIVLNALDMQITKATLFAPNETALRVKQNLGKQIVSLKLPSEIPPGKYQLALEFNGMIGEQAQGLFYVKYPTGHGRKVMLGTQMEPADARRMFPCWDEPVFRASFQLTVVVPEKHLPISNTPIERERSLAGGMKEVTFARTPPMASYLVVFVSGELEQLQDRVEGVQIRVITTEGKKEQGRYALEATKKLLAYYNRYFGIKYPLPKLDQIAIPGGFSGAMENWGGITYNESTLLFDPQSSSEQTKESIFVTVAHEMAHQWFGNLVTMAWWDNLWLNEGFASWMENKATDHFNPRWQIWLTADAEKTAVMAQDAQGATHPIQQPVENESEANDAFDNITYQKGGAFLRMLESYLGEEEFRRGVHEYLSAHLYSNTTTADLWEALEKTSGKPIKAISAGWTEQPGLPVVHIKTDCVNGSQVISLAQERFTIQDPKAEPLLWKIPVALLDSAHPKAVHFTLLEGKSAEAALPDCQGVIKANAGAAGYYRVAYDEALFQKLEKVFSELPAADRLNLLNDAWAMVEAGRASVTNYLDLAESVQRDKTLAIWEQFLSTLVLLDGLEQKQTGRAAFQEYARRALRPQLRRLGWNHGIGESDTDGLLRARVITALGWFGDRQVIVGARARFEKFLANPKSLPADLRAPVLKTVGRYSDRKTYNQIHELARNASGTEERQLYYLAMAGALDPALAKETLALSLTDETVPQETTALVIQVAQAGEQQDLAWEFAKNNIKELLPRVDSFERNSYLPSLLNTFSDAPHAEELETYVKANVSEDALPKAKEAAESIRFKAALKQRALPEVDRWVAARLSAK